MVLVLNPVAVIDGDEHADDVVGTFLVDVLHADGEHIGVFVHLGDTDFP